jgi:hypothetical protein
MFRLNPIMDEKWMMMNEHNLWWITKQKSILFELDFKVDNDG